MNASHSSLLSEPEDFEIVSVASTSFHDTGSGVHYHHTRLPLQPQQSPEPVPQREALERYETACFSAEDIQAFTQRAIEGTHGYMINDAPKMRPVRVYIPSAYQALQPEHVLTLRHAKLAFPFVHLIVGVVPDQLGVFDSVERAETLRHVRWVDEVIVAENITEIFLKDSGIDYIVHEPSTPWNAGFDLAKQLGKLLPVRPARSTGNLGTIRRPKSQNGRQSVSSTNSDTPEPHGSIDVFGFGI